jgi:hypothetical protein
MKRRIIAYLSILLFALSISGTALAQCSMCASNAEASEANRKKDTVMGLNVGIMYIMILPYATVGIIGFWWYRNYKKKPA